MYRIKKVREEKNMSQIELSERANVARQIVSDLESGKEVNTTIATLKKLAQALDCKISDIFAPDV